MITNNDTNITQKPSIVDVLYMNIKRMNTIVHDRYGIIISKPDQDAAWSVIKQLIIQVQDKRYYMNEKIMSLKMEALNINNEYMDAYKSLNRLNVVACIKNKLTLQSTVVECVRRFLSQQIIILNNNKNTIDNEYNIAVQSATNESVEIGEFFDILRDWELY